MCLCDHSAGNLDTCIKSLTDLIHVRLNVTLYTLCIFAAWHVLRTCLALVYERILFIKALKLRKYYTRHTAIYQLI